MMSHKTHCWVKPIDFIDNPQLTGPINFGNIFFCCIEFQIVRRFAGILIDG
jgi:hypothetical protein